MIVWQRVLAALLIVLQVAALGTLSLSPMLPIILLLALLLVLLPAVHLPRSMRARLPVYLLLAFGFYLASRYWPLSGRSFSPVMGASLALAIGQYVVALQILELGIHKRRLPLYFPAMSLVALSFIGAIVDYGRVWPAFQWIALSSVILLIFYFLGMTAPISSGGRTYRAARIIRILCLIAVLGIGWVTADLLKRYQTELDDVFSRVVVFDRVRSEVGFSDSSKLDGVTKFRSRNENNVALRVFAEEPAHYLRGRAFTSYNGGQWSSGVARWRRLPEPDHAADTGHHVFTVRELDRRAATAMDVWPAPPLTGPLFAPIEAIAYSVPVADILLDDNLIAEAPQLLPGHGFTVHLLDPLPAFKEQPATLEAALAIPSSLDAAVHDLARELFQTTTTVDERIAATRRYFAGYKYSLGLALPVDRDPLTFFLLEKPDAHCEFFAAGTVMLLRLGGVPARYVTGFVATEYNPYGRYWLARNKDAHAWAEVYGVDHGWRTVDTTPPAGRPQEVTHSYAAYAWDTLKFRLREFLILARSDVLSAIATLARHLALLAVRVLFTGWTGGIVAAAALAAVVGILIWRLRHQRRRHLYHYTHPMHPTLRAMDRRVRRRGIERKSSETIHQFAHRIEAERGDQSWASEAAAWYRSYADIRYSPRSHHEASR